MANDVKLADMSIEQLESLCWRIAEQQTQQAQMMRAVQEVLLSKRQAAQESARQTADGQIRRESTAHA